MRNLIRKGSEAADVDLTPMLDVVFILLIFFIVTATFTRETALAVEPPPPPATNAQPSPATTIYVDQDSLIRIDGRLTDIGLVRANIERINALTPDRPAIIQAHPKARSGTIIYIRDQIESAGIAQVNVTISQPG